MLVLSSIFIFSLMLVTVCSNSKDPNSNGTKVVQLEAKHDAAVAPPTSVDSRFFDLGGIINELFPELNQGNQGGFGRNPPGMDFPTNSQFYPADSIQGPNSPMTTGPGSNWPIIDDAKHFPNINAQPSYPNQGSFGAFPQTQYPNQPNFSGVPNNRYPKQGNFGSSYPNQGGQYPNQGNLGTQPGENGGFPNQWNYGGQPVLNSQYPNSGGALLNQGNFGVFQPNVRPDYPNQGGQYPNQGNLGTQPGQNGGFPNQWNYGGQPIMNNQYPNSGGALPNQGNFGGSQPNARPEYPNQGIPMGSRPNFNTQYPDQGNTMSSRPDLISQYPTEGNVGGSQPNQFQPFPNPINSGRPLQNEFPSQGGNMNQNPKNFRPGTSQIGDGTLDSLIPPDSQWNNSPNDFNPAQFNRSNPNLPDAQVPVNPEDNSNAILGNPVIVPPTTTERGKIIYPSSTESAVKKQCVQDCDSTSEYNPVCGSDNVTYINPGKFVCARNCGIDVFVVQRGRCPDDAPFPRNVLKVKSGGL